MRKPRLYWIKERQNPQLGTYYVACGLMFKSEAKRMASPLYGDNIMHRFYTKDAYDARLAELRAKGEAVQ
jgi:hypothetical protein